MDTTAIAMAIARQVLGEKIWQNPYNQQVEN